LKNLSVSLCLLAFLSCGKGQRPQKASAGNPDYEAALAYREKGQADSAFRYFSQAKEAFLENADSLGAGKCLINMAIILTNSGDYFGGQETSLEALRYFDESNPAHHYYLGSNFNNLGIATHQLKDTERAIAFYDSAIRLSNDSLDTRLYLNNKADAYNDDGQHAAALAIYERIIKEVSKNKREYARVLTNTADTRWRINPAYDAAPALLEALQIREREHDLWGMNSSYAHLSEYYAHKLPDSAVWYAHKRYAVARQIKSATDQISALRQLIRLSPDGSIKQYFEAYQRLSDSVQRARAAANNQFALIRYEAEKSKADNLRLQNENAEKAYQINRQRMLMLMIAFLTAGLGAFAIHWYKKRKQQLELHAQNQIKAHQLKTSRKIHDVVANGIYRVMTEIENKSDINREGILDRLEDMYEKSRDISYETENASIQEQDFSERIATLLRSFATDATKVMISGNSVEVWKDIPGYTRHEVWHILEEIMVNMRKHSRATHALILFQRGDIQFDIHYSDNGVGMPKELPQGNGLASMSSRIEILDGSIMIENGRQQGVNILVSFPVASTTG